MSVNSFSETTRLFSFQTNHFLNYLCKELHLDFDWRPQVNALQFYYCKFGWSLDPLRGISPLRELCTPLKSRQNRSLYHPITDPASLTLIMKTYLPSVPLRAAGWQMKTKLSGYVTWEFSIFKKKKISVLGYKTVTHASVRQSEFADSWLQLWGCLLLWPPSIKSDRMTPTQSWRGWLFP